MCYCLTNESFKAVGHCMSQVRFPAQVRPMSVQHEAIQLQFLKKTHIQFLMLLPEHLYICAKRPELKRPEKAAETKAAPPRFCFRVQKPELMCRPAEPDWTPEETCRCVCVCTHKLTAHTNTHIQAKFLERPAIRAVPLDWGGETRVQEDRILLGVKYPCPTWAGVLPRWAAVLFQSSNSSRVGCRAQIQIIRHFNVTQGRPTGGFEQLNTISIKVHFHVKRWRPHKSEYY